MVVRTILTINSRKPECLLSLAYILFTSFADKPKCFPYQFYTQRLHGANFFCVTFHELISSGHFLKPFGVTTLVKSDFRQCCFTPIIPLHVFLQAKQHTFSL